MHRGGTFGARSRGAVSVVLATALAAALAVPARGASSGPRVRVDHLSHDFGVVKSDTSVKHVWTLRNEGDETLEIRELRPSCGCTVNELERDRVPPGGESRLQVTFDPAGQEGKVRRTIAVNTNDPILPRFQLVVLAEVQVGERVEGADSHPPIAGQSLLMGECASCHARPAVGKSGGELYAAVCAMCHGPRAAGGRAPGIRDPHYLASHSDDELHAKIAYGTSNPRMPGYHEMMGGPLSEGQVRSLVELIRDWGPLSSTESGNPE